MNEEIPSPETQYANSDGVSIAYQVFGSGTHDLVVVPGIASHIDLSWDIPETAILRRRLAQSFRVILFDKRGQGLSDSLDGATSLEQRIDDVRAVMQAAGSTKAVIFAESQGGAMAVLFAATYPQMVDKLILYGTMARFAQSPDYPYMPTLEKMTASAVKSWGTPASVRAFVPSVADDDARCAELAKFQRQVASPSAIGRMVKADAELDVRSILAQVHRPTMVLHRRFDKIVRRENGRYLADQIPDALFIELPGGDHPCGMGEVRQIASAIEFFAANNTVVSTVATNERFVTTVLFTDIVGSTLLAAKLGDARWRDLLGQFHTMGREQLDRYRGREIDTAGDGLFAIFDGPGRAIFCASEMCRRSRELGIDVRAGLHTGEVEPTDDNKVSGLAVHIGARIMGLADAAEVIVSNTTRDLVTGSDIAFTDFGTHSLKGVPNHWRLSRVLAN